jgi:hypothetical protein
MVASASEVEGGAESAIAGVEEVGTTKAADAAEGEIIDRQAQTSSPSRKRPSALSGWAMRRANLLPVEISTVGI